MLTNRMATLKTSIRKGTVNVVGRKYFSQPVANTGTIHMFGIATYADAVHATKSKEPGALRKRVVSRLFAFLSLLVVCVQLLALSFVVYESSISTCTTHSDCDIGRFCLGTGIIFRQPRCGTCSSIDGYYPNAQCEEVSSNGIFDHTVLWFDSDFTAHYDDDNDIQNKNRNDLECMAKEYCSATELYGKDYTNTDNTQLNLTVKKFSHDQFFVLFFVAILFGR